MEPLEQSTGRSIRLALVAFGLLALLGVVAFASRSGFSGSSNAKPTPGYVSYAFTAFLIVFVLMIPIAAYTFIMQAREGDVARKSFKSRVLQNIATATVFGFIGFGVIYLKRHRGHLFNLNSNALKNLSAQKATHHGGRPGAFEPTFEWPVLGVALLVLAILGFFAYRSYRTRKLRKAVPLEPTMAEDFAATIGDAIGELEAEPDARPVEYLGRILGGLTSRSDSVSRLTSLFEEAKFSSHEIDTVMKREAIDALRAIRDDLNEGSA